MKIENYIRFTHFLPFKIKKTSILNRIIGVILLVVTATSFGQEKSKPIDNSLISGNEYIHNLQLEKFFLHTNKTSYFPGENIWFKAYVVNDTDNKPSMNTSNLHINLYDSQKELITSTLFLANEGKATGKIELSKETISGKYYLEVTTQWNQNFDKNSSITSIDIISPNQNKKLNTENQEIANTSLSDDKTNSVALDFFPQSDIFLENTENTIAFTSSNYEAPISISGDIIDDKTGIVVAKLKSNTYGMGSFNAFLRPNRTYTASVNYNDLNKKFAIPKAQLKGFIVAKKEKQSNKTSINFVLKTNEETLKSYRNKTLTAILHRNGTASVVVPIKLKKGVFNYSFNLKKEDFYNGINTITVFNKSNTPIADYPFFHNNQEEIQLNITKSVVEKDSLTLNFDLMDEVSVANLSVSILPEETKVYENNTSILSAFLLAPYLDNASLNLSEITSSNNNENITDLIVATRIKKNTFPYKEENKIIPTEYGARIKGNVSANVQDLTDYKVMLSSTDSGILLLQTIGDSNSFIFDNLILKHPSKYKLALLDPQGKIIKTGFRMSNELISYKADSTLLNKTAILQRKKLKKTDKNDTSLIPILTDDVTLLNEVNLSKKRKTNNNVLQELGIKNSPLESELSRLNVIKEHENLPIVDYLNRIAGLRVINRCSIDGSFSVVTTRGFQSILGNHRMNMFVDGILIQNPDFLCMMYTTDFIAVSVNSSGAGAGIRGKGGLINFYTKKGGYNPDLSIPNEDIVVSETDFGFSISENMYKNQLFQYKNNDSRKFYGTIGWFPNVDVLPNSTYKLKLDKKGFKGLKVIVNGMNTDGKLVHKIVSINSEVF